MGSVASVDNLAVGFYFIMNDFIVVNSELLKIDVGGILKSLITANDNAEGRRMANLPRWMERAKVNLIADYCLIAAARRWR
jgi:hypothetical protein